MNLTRTLVLLPVLAGACQGSYELRAFGEAFVEEGIPASAVQDGWGIRFTEFVVSIGEVSLEGDDRVELDGWYVFDLTHASNGDGHLLAEMNDVHAGDYSAVRYRFGNLALTLGHVDGEGGCDPVYTPGRYAGMKSPGSEPGRGATLYAAQCASCHGEHGGGDGPMADGMDPRPTNLTAVPHSTLVDDYLFFRIAEGGEFFPFASAMPAFSTLPEEDVWALVDEVYAIRHGH